MEAERVNAFTIYYGPFELEGEQLHGTGYAVDRDTVPNGFYCYDVRIDEVGEGKECVFVGQCPLKEDIGGTVTSDVPVDFRSGNRMFMKGVQFLDNVPLVSLERLLEQKSDGPVTTETADFCMLQG